MFVCCVRFGHPDMRASYSERLSSRQKTSYRCLFPSLQSLDIVIKKNLNILNFFCIVFTYRHKTYLFTGSFLSLLPIFFFTYKDFVVTFFYHFLLFRGLGPGAAGEVYKSNSSLDLDHEIDILQV
jgi:hypothetical protein